MESWKRRSYDNSRFAVAGASRAGGGDREGETGRARRQLRAAKLLRVILRWWVRVIVYLFRRTECTVLSVNPHVTCGLRRIMMCQGGFTCEECTIWWAGVTCGALRPPTRAKARWGGGREMSGVRKICVLSAQFCCDPKMALENKVY